jgi:hypothetical protein
MRDLSFLVCILAMFVKVTKEYSINLTGKQFGMFRLEINPQLLLIIVVVIYVVFCISGLKSGVQDKIKE